MNIRELKRILNDVDLDTCGNYQVVTRRFDVTPSGATTSIDYDVTEIKIQVLEPLNSDLKEGILAFYY